MREARQDTPQAGWHRSTTPFAHPQKQHFGERWDEEGCSFAPGALGWAARALGGSSHRRAVEAGAGVWR